MCAPKISLVIGRVKARSKIYYLLGVDCAVAKYTVAAYISNLRTVNMLFIESLTFCLYVQFSNTSKHENHACAAFLYYFYSIERSFDVLTPTVLFVISEYDLAYYCTLVWHNCIIVRLQNASSKSNAVSSGCDVRKVGHFSPQQWGHTVL